MSFLPTPKPKRVRERAFSHSLCVNQIMSPPQWSGNSGVIGGQRQEIVWTISSSAFYGLWNFLYWPFLWLLFAQLYPKCFYQVNGSHIRTRVFVLVVGKSHNKISSFNHFKVYNSGALSTLTMLYNLCLWLVPGHFCCPRRKETLYPWRSPTPFSPIPSPWQQPCFPPLCIMDCFIVSLQNSHGDTLTPSGMVLGGETFGMYLSLNEVMSRAPWWVKVLIKIRES